jgi:uncharacterized protein YbjQ (UPF0145 family)
MLVVRRMPNMSFCKECGAKLIEGASFCTSCGFPVTPTEAGEIREGMVIVTTPTVPGYEVKEILGIVSGLTARTRGIGGKLVAGIESMIGGEVSAFTYEMEKARKEAIKRLSEEARRMGANAVVGVDVETSEVFEGVVLISATGTAVNIEKEEKI